MHTDKKRKSNSRIVNFLYLCQSVPHLWLTVLLCFASTTRAADRPPNIVFILADDLGYADVGFDGRKVWTTPNLDRLASQGTIFRRWYSAGVVCAPSRAAFLTGRYGIHNGVTGNTDMLDPRETTVAEALKSRGYATALCGKWHLCPIKPDDPGWPLNQGFDEFFGYIGGREAWEKFPKELWDGREKKPVDGYADNLFTDRAIDFVKRQHDASKPFFLYLALIAPHGWDQAPPQQATKFEGKFEGDDKPYRHKSGTYSKPIEHPYANYAAMVANLDAQVGRLLATLDELKLADDTLVVFTSDNGATFEPLNAGASNHFDSNAPFRGQKRTLWEGGMHMPACVRWTGHVKAGSESQTLVHNVDLLPTFCAAAGATVDPTWNVDGVNLLDVWTGKSAPPDRTLFWEWRAEGTTQWAAMKGDFKLVVTGGNTGELFDVAKDPSERRNIRSDQGPIVSELTKALEEWQKSETNPPKRRPTTRGTAEE
jgi:arylsulfatase A